MDNKKLKTIIIVVLLIACLIGAGAYGFFSNNGGTIPPSSSSAASDNSVYTNTKNRVNALTQQLKSNPNDLGLQQDLGNAYYDLGTASQKIAPNEANEAYSEAIKFYQNVLKSKQDLNVMTDMATAAFYSGQLDLAEKTYQKALSINPNFAPALYNYGIYIYEIKKDSQSAIRMWQTVINQDPNGPLTTQIKSLISQVKG